MVCLWAWTLACFWIQITIYDHIPIYNLNDCIFTLQIEHRRESLRQMFGTPCHKWHHRGKFPFKLTLQLLKVLVVTLQVGIVTDQIGHVIHTPHFRLQISSILYNTHFTFVTVMCLSESIGWFLKSDVRWSLPIMVRSCREFWSSKDILEPGPGRIPWENSRSSYKMVEGVSS